MSEAAGSDALARRFVEALHALDAEGEAAVEAMTALFADEATVTNAALRRAGTERRGRDAVRTFWTDYAHTFREARTEFRAVTTGGDAIGLFWTTRGRDAQGEPIEYDGASLLLLDGQGRIATFSGYFDPENLQLAPLPVREGTRPSAPH